jgi:hypothetical protein
MRLWEIAISITKFRLRKFLHESGDCNDVIVVPSCHVLLVDTRSGKATGVNISSYGGSYCQPHGMRNGLYVCSSMTYPRYEP